MRIALADGLAEVCRRSDASSVHVTFPTEEEWHLLGEHGYLLRTHRQFHWKNEGYASFDGFLAALSSRKRKTIRRERADALSGDITVHRLTGADLTESIWDAFFEFYMDTGSRKWGRPYLTRSFYSIVGEKMRDRILLVMAKRNGRWIAGAINFIGSDTLFGRHWGAIENHPFLHFEVCYYQAIDFAIEHKLGTVEAGAGGQHKITRGYMPVTTYSAHYIVDPGLRRAIADFLTQERAHVAAEVDELAEAAPFRKADRWRPPAVRAISSYRPRGDDGPELRSLGRHDVLDARLPPAHFRRTRAVRPAPVRLLGRGGAHFPGRDQRDRPRLLRRRPASARHRICRSLCTVARAPAAVAHGARTHRGTIRFLSVLVALLALPLLTAAFDYLENHGIAEMLAAGPKVAPDLVAWASFWTQAKSIAALTTELTCVVLLALRSCAGGEALRFRIREPPEAALAVIVLSSADVFDALLGDCFGLVIGCAGI